MAAVVAFVTSLLRTLSFPFLLASCLLLGVSALGADVTQKSKPDIEQLRQHRAYQQEIAKSREEEKKETTAFEEQLSAAGPEEKFRRWIERAESLSTKADFRAAMRAWTRAVAIKPPTIVLGEREEALHAALQAQNRSVEVTLVSDGQTWVSIRLVRPPEKLTTAKVSIQPGNYEVVGRRSGYGDVVVPISVRADEAPREVKIVCKDWL